MRIRPIEDRIILQVEPIETISAGGIIIGDPEKHEHPPRNGIVLAVGPGLKNTHGGRDPMDVKVGERVQFTGTSGMDCTWDDLDNVMVITQLDVLFAFE